MHKVSASSCGVGLKSSMLQELLCKTLHENCNDAGLCRRARKNFSKAFREGRDLTRTEMKEMTLLLEAALDSLVTTRPSVVATIHSTIGLLCQTQNDTSSAIRSFTTALWIQVHENSASNQVDVALSIHRIALCYASLAQNELAVALLNRALELYKDARLNKKHPYILHARQELRQVKETQRMMLHARTWCQKNNGEKRPRRCEHAPVEKITSTKLLLVSHARLELAIVEKMEKQKYPRKNSLVSISSLSSCSTASERVTEARRHSNSSLEDFSSIRACAA